MFVDAVDSHFVAVRDRLNAIVGNPYVAKGYSEAQDWPPKNVTPNVFYLLTLGDKPIGRQMYSAQTPVKFHMVQWVWIIKGTDLQSGQRAANRGDRFRVNQAMKGALTTALYPHFAEKKTWSLVGDTWTGVSLNPVEYITWSPADFAPAQPSSKETGIIYGAAALRIWNMLDSIPS